MKTTKLKDSITALADLDYLLGFFDSSKTFNLTEGAFGSTELKNLAELSAHSNLPNLSKRFWFLLGDSILEENYSHFDKAYTAFCNAGLDSFSSYQRISYFLEQKGTIAYHAKLTSLLKDVPDLVGGNPYHLFNYAAIAYSFTKPEDKFQERIKQEEIERLNKLAESAKQIKPIELETFVKYTQK